MVKIYYPADFTQQEIYGLEQQLKHFVVDASNFIDRFLRLLVTLPVSTASAEHAFSALKIVKTRLCNKMEDEFVANSLLVNIEREIAEKYSHEDRAFHGRKETKI
jgi:hypothetical protein